MNNNVAPNQNGDKNNKEPKNRQSMSMFLVLALVCIMVSHFVTATMKDGKTKEITYDAFIEMLEEDKVESVEDTGLTWEITPRTQPLDNVKMTYYTGKMDDDTLLPLLKEKGVEIKPYIQDTLSTLIWEVVWALAPILLMFAIFGMFMRRMGGGGSQGCGGWPSQLPYQHCQQCLPQL